MIFTKIYPNQKFNKWVTIKQVPYFQQSGRKRLKWLCRYECGNTALVQRTDLLKNKSTKCRKCNNTAPKDLSGQVFSRWTVVSCNIKKHNRRYCKCKCLCGNTYEVAAQTLSNGTSTQCINCFNLQRDGTNYTGNPLYDIWITMMARCYNKKNIGYRHYGGRGIIVGKKWHDFNNFVKDMSPRPEGNYSIDRINNNKGYYSSNCHWATWIEQARNRRNNRLETYNGITKCLPEWAEELKIKPDTLFGYLRRHTIEEAIIFYTSKNEVKSLVISKECHARKKEE